jgi:hypothetical protein
MKINDYIKRIKKLDACGEALKDALNYETSEALWADCKRGDWMLWLLRRVLDLSDDAMLRKLTLAKARCAKLVIHLMKDERSRKAVDVAEQFGLGIASREDLNAAAYAATAATVAATYAAAAVAAAATVAATYATAADAAAYAAYADAAATYATDAERKDILSKCADIVRDVFPDINVYLGL